MKTIRGNRMARLALAALALALGLNASCSARDLYVNNVLGDDQLSGLASKVSGVNGPVRSINCALAIALPSDRVLVANTGQPYREMIAIAGPRLNGTERLPFVLQSDGAVLDGTVAADRKAWRQIEPGLFAFRPRRLTYQQLFNDGKPLPRVTHTWGRKIEPLRWALAPDAILLGLAEEKLPRDYDLRHAGLQTGITLYNTRHVVVEGFVIQGFQLDGVNAHDSARDCKLNSLECRANGRAGLSVGGASRVLAEGCRFYDNGRVQVRTEQVARLALTNCEVDPETAPDFAHLGRELKVDGKQVLHR